jgi:hypothetical protein
MRILNEVPENMLISSLVVHPVLEQANPQRSDEELSTLEEQIINEQRLREPLTIWQYNGEDPEYKGKHLVVDGFSRRKIVMRLHEAQDFSPLVPVWLAEFESLEHARYWIGINQDAKRNLTTEQKAYYYGKLYKELRKEENLKAYLESKGRDLFQVSDLAEFIADLHKVSRRYIFFSNDFYEGIEKIASKNPDFASRILSRQVVDEQGEYVSVSMETVKKLSKIKKVKAINNLHDLKEAAKVESQKQASVEETVEDSKGVDINKLFREFMEVPSPKKLDVLVRELQKVLKASESQKAA